MSEQESQDRDESPPVEGPEAPPEATEVSASAEEAPRAAETTDTSDAASTSESGEGASGREDPAAPVASAPPSEGDPGERANEGAAGDAAAAPPAANEGATLGAPVVRMETTAMSLLSLGNEPGKGERRLGDEVLIEAEGLCKYYGRFTAVEGVSFEVRRGQVVAFLGPNGAGKSTTMKILTGMIAPDAGEARIAGLSVIHNRLEVARRLGYLPENGPLYSEMTPHELLTFLGEARGLDRDRVGDRVALLARRLDLRTVMSKPIHKLSKGFKQRVGLAQALLHEPEVLIMDEPTTGLDPNQIRDVRRTIREFGENKAILLSTHILQEVEAIADRVVFIHQGRIVFQGTVEGLKASAPTLEGAFAQHTGQSGSSWAS